MQQGAAELKNWLEDIGRNGIPYLNQIPAPAWQQFSARMVDQQLSGVARLLTQLQQILKEDDAYRQSANIITSLYLIAEGFNNWDSLPATHQLEIAQLAGATINKKELLNTKAVQDKWLVASIEQGSRDQLTFRKVWLIGEKTARKALLLHFVFGNNYFEEHFQLGTVYLGEIVFYPGPLPYRGLFKQKETSKAPFSLKKAISGFEELTKRFGKSLAIDPWIPSIPTHIKGVTPIYRDKKFWLIDSNQLAIPLSKKSEKGLWKLVAISGNRPLHLFGEWDGAAFLPLTLFHQEKVIQVL